MHTETRTTAANDTISTLFQLVTIVMVGLFSLTETVRFLASAVI